MQNFNKMKFTDRQLALLSAVELCTPGDQLHMVMPVLAEALRARYYGLLQEAVHASGTLLVSQIPQLLETITSELRTFRLIHQESLNSQTLILPPSTSPSVASSSDRGSTKTESYEMAAFSRLESGSPVDGTHGQHHSQTAAGPPSVDNEHRRGDVPDVPSPPTTPTPSGRPSSFLEQHRSLAQLLQQPPMLLPSAGSVTRYCYAPNEPPMSSGVPGAFSQESSCSSTTATQDAYDQPLDLRVKISNNNLLLHQ